MILSENFCVGIIPRSREMLENFEENLFEFQNNPTILQRLKRIAGLIEFKEYMILLSILIFSRNYFLQNFTLPLVALIHKMN